MAEAKEAAKKSKEAEEVKNGSIEETGTTEVQADIEPKEAVKTAKAGKRSAKAIQEAEEKQAKEARKAAKSEADAEDKPKVQQKPPRTRLERRGKNFRKAAELVDKDKQYSLVEALELATKTSPTKFDATVELHINLNVDPRQADQNIRGAVVLPAGTGKTVRVAVFADVDDAAKATKAGADIVGIEEITKLLDKGQLNFDILIATPTQMAKLGKYARTLGPKGLMPNPKSGTVTTDVAKAVKEAKAGRVEYRVDSTGIIHVGIGKVSFGPEKLAENARVLIGNIRGAKPASIKGAYVKSVHVATTMGPGISIAPSEI